MTSDIHHLDQWIGEGLITADQGAAIEAYEHRMHASGPSSWIEVLAYVGAVLVLAAGTVIMGDVWPELNRAGQITVTAAAAVILVAAGLFFTGSNGRMLQRVGRTALLLAIVPIGLTAGLIVEPNASGELTALVSFTASFIFSLAVYLRRASWSQQAALFVSSVGAATTMAALLSGDDPTWQPGAAMLFIGALWLGLSMSGRMIPEILGMALGLGAMLLGSFILIEASAPHYSGIMLIAFVAMAVGIVAMGATRDLFVLIAGGLAGLIIYVPWLVDDVLGDSLGAPIALLAAGVLLIGSAIYLTRHKAGD